MGELAEINPRTTAIPADEEVSFIGMAQLDATAATTESGTTRRFSDVSKGYTVFRDGDLLVAKITPCFENSKIGQARLLHKIGVGSTEFHIVRSGKCLHDRYLLNFLRQDWVRTQGELRMTGSAGQRRVPANYLAGLRIPVLPLHEQRRIAAILDQADALRAKRREAIDRLTALAQSAFLDMFGPPVDWPNRWPMGTIRDMAEDVQYGTSGKAGDTGKWPIVRMGNVTDEGRLDLSDLKWIDLAESDIPKFTLRRGDLLFNRTNSKEKVGKTCVVQTDESLAFAGYLVRVRLRTEHRAEFLNAYMTSSYGKALRKSMAKAAVNQANINATEMQSIPVALPPTALQERFASVLARIDAERDRQHTGLAKLDALFASLQSRAFRGEL